MIKVGYIQNSPEFGDKNRNLENIIKKLEKAKDALIVLPELFATGYNFQNKSEVSELSEKADRGITFDAMQYISKKNSLTLVYGFAEKYKDKFFNSSALIENGSLKAVYRKSHLFYKEKNFFSPGDTGFEPVVLSNGVKVGMLICFDWIFPESHRTLALKGAHIICHSTNLVLPFCPDATVVRCVENRVFTILSNRIGRETRNQDDFTFIGNSEIVTPTGNILKRSEKDQEDFFITEINPFDAENKNINPLNNIFEDRRTEFYS